MNEYAYYNGVFMPYDSACIPLSDRSVFFSDAVYDVIVGRGDRVYQLDEHLDRLFHNAKRIWLANLPTKSEIKNAVEILLSEAKADGFMLYVQLSGNSERRCHERKDQEVNTLITVTECNIPTKLESIRAITLPDARHNFCDIKTTNLLPAVLSVEEAQRRGADIAIFHKNLCVTECSYANISFLKDGALVTHPFDTDILPGITQQNLEIACCKLGIPHFSRSFSVSELYEADAVLITSTTKLIKVCTEIDATSLIVSAYETVSRLFDELKQNLYGEIGRKNPI